MASRRSAIWGNEGDYGITHVWRDEGTAQVGGAPSACRRSNYCCMDCGAEFVHRYDLEVNIFAAMRREGVPAQCAGPRAEFVPPALLREAPEARPLREAPEAWPAPLCEAPAWLGMRARPKAPVPEALRAVLARYAADGPVDLSWTTFRHIVTYFETGEPHGHLEVACADFGYACADFGYACADFGYERAELDALRAAGKTARDVAAEIAARGAAD